MYFSNEKFVSDYHFFLNRDVIYRKRTMFCHACAVMILDITVHLSHCSIIERNCKRDFHVNQYLGLKWRVLAVIVNLFRPGCTAKVFPPRSSPLLAKMIT